MNYFLMKKNFNLKEYDFDVLINPRLTKREQYLLNIFIDNAQKNDKFTEISYTLDLFKTDYMQLIEEIENIKKKSISIVMTFKGEHIRRIFINFFETIVFENNKIIYKLSNEFSIAKNSDNFYNRIQLLTVIQLDKFSFYNFIKIILKKYIFEKEIIFDISLEELKDILQIPQNQYTRFYDLENKILKPLLNDLNKLYMPVYFEKIKSSIGKGSKITGIKVKCINTFFIEVNSDTNRLLKEFAENIDDFFIAYDNIFYYRKTHNYEETKKYVELNIDSIFLPTQV